MFLLLLLLWIIFNGNFTIEILAFGIIIAAAVCVFLTLFTDFSIKKELKFIPLIPSLIVYVLVLIAEIFKANIATLRFIFKGPKGVTPVICHFKVNFKTDFARVLLANSITLTPGTITVSCHDNEFYVHCLDASLAAGMADSCFVRRLERMEAKL